MRMRRLTLLALLLCPSLVWAADAQTCEASTLKARSDLAATQRELALTKILLGLYRQAVDGQIAAPFDRQIDELARQREAFEQAHPAPAGQRWDWTLPVPALVPVEPTK